MRIQNIVLTDSFLLEGKVLNGEKEFCCWFSVLLALQDRAAQLNVSEDRLHLSGAKFYCTARATHGVNRGREPPSESYENTGMAFNKIKYGFLQCCGSGMFIPDPGS